MKFSVTLIQRGEVSVTVFAEVLLKTFTETCIKTFEMPSSND